LIASCKLRSLDPERYLAEMIRVMPYWPRDRYLELAPAYWAQTRARLDPVELDAELGSVTVPPVFVDTGPATRRRAEVASSVTPRLSRQLTEASRTGSVLRIRNFGGADN